MKNIQNILRDTIKTTFLGASSHLYYSLCLSVHRSVHPSVLNAFVKIAENRVFSLKIINGHEGECQCV